MKNKLLITSSVFLSLVFLMALFSNYLPYSFDEQNIDIRLMSSSFSHPMGTDQLGRDLLSRVFSGARLSLTIGVVTALISLTIGTLFGIVSGYKGGLLDHVLMRVVDMVFTFPSLLISILVMMFLGQGLTGIIVALSISSWASQARLIRGQVLQLKTKEFVVASQALGQSHFKTVWLHILPNVWVTALVNLTFLVPNNIMAESFLSFIGLGVQPPASSWGTLASEGFRAMKSYPHLILFPGIILFLTLYAFNYISDYLIEDQKINGRF